MDRTEEIDVEEHCVNLQTRTCKRRGKKMINIAKLGVSLLSQTSSELDW